MKLRLYRLELPLEHPFTIARNSISVQRSLIVELEQDGVFGYGEATEDAYYGHSFDSMSEAIASCSGILESYSFGSPSELWEQLAAQLGKDSFSLSAINLASYDLYGKLCGQRTYEAMGLSWDGIPDSSYTIGIDSIDVMVSKLKERPGWSVYKIKLGTDRDVEIVRQLREATSATLRVDANCGWSVEETIDNSHQLKELGVEFIEQPLPAGSPEEDHRRVFEASSLPIVADESCLTEPDVEACHGRFHGVNVKLCKCGGLTPAERMLRSARRLGMKTMLGCMVESSVGISAAAQLLPLLDYADLDGAVLLADDVASGVEVDRGRVALAAENGNGVSLLPAALERYQVDV